MFLLTLGGLQSSGSGDTANAAFLRGPSCCSSWDVFEDPRVQGCGCTGLSRRFLGLAGLVTSVQDGLCQSEGSGSIL